MRRLPQIALFLAVVPGLAHAGGAKGAGGSEGSSASGGAGPPEGEPPSETLRVSGPAVEEESPAARPPDPDADSPAEDEPAAANEVPRASQPADASTPTAERDPSGTSAPAVEARPEEGDEEEDASGVRRIVVGSLFDEPEGIPRIAGSAHAIGERELEAYESDDIHQVLTTVPGVYVRGEDGFGLRPNIGLRGANSDRSAKVTLMEDGVLFGPAPYAAPAAYYFPLTTRMVGVEVFKGPAAVRFGPNTIGGAINLRTREIPTEAQGGIDLAGGRFGYGKGHAWVGASHRGFGFVAEASRIQSNGFKELDGGGDTGFEKNDTMLKLGYRTPSSRPVSHVIQLKGGFATERSNEDYLGLSDADFADTPYRRYAASQLGLMSWWRTQAEATYAVADRRGLEFEARLYRHDFDRAWRKFNRFAIGPDVETILANPDGGQNAVLFAVLRGEQDGDGVMIGTNDRRFVSQGVSTAVRWKPRGKWVDQNLELGIRLHGDSIERDHTEDEHSMMSGVLVPADEDTVVNVRNRGAAFATAFHLHDAITIADRFTVAPGVRVELISTNFENRQTEESSRRLYAIPVPGIGMHVLATDWLAVFAGVHRGFSPVAPGQAREVEPEFSINYEAGTRARWRGLTAEAIGFFNDYSNLTGECTFSGGCDDTMINQQFNAGEVFVYGAEATAGYRHRWASGLGVGGGARYTYTGSRFQTDFESALPQFGDVSAGDSLAYVPVHLAGGWANVGGSRWDVNVRGAYTGPMRDVPGQGTIPEAEKIPGFFVLDVSAEVRLFRFLRVYGIVNNATAAQYMASRRPFGARPGAPLTFMFGIKALLRAPAE